MNVLKEWTLRNGIQMKIIDETVRYYGDYHNVKLILIATVPIKEGYLSCFKDSPYYERILELLVPSREFRREFLKVGVSGEVLERTKQEIVENFEKNALLYMEKDHFPAKFAKSEFEKLEKELSLQDKIKARIAEVDGVEE